MKPIVRIVHYVGETNMKKLKEQVISSAAKQLEISKIIERIIPGCLQFTLVTSNILEIELSFSYPYDLAQINENNPVARAPVRGLCKFHDGQTLADVRQTLLCPNMEISTNVDQNPHEPLDCLGNNDLIHSFFYINNNVYVDSQLDKITEEHYVVIQKWAQDKGHTFEKVLSQEIQLLDLELVCGERYIFQHLKGCGHSIYFLDVKFARPNNTLDCYPKINDFHGKNL